jgi:5-methylthioadenosine/S-adenosylhomocysteine deaminase
MAILELFDADVVIQDADTVLRRASVIVEDGTIKEIRASGRDEAPRDAQGDRHERIDCRGLMLLPGMINSHTHLYQVLMRGIGKDLTVREWVRDVTYPRARRLSAQQYYDGVMLACADALRNGTTTVVDHVTHYCRFFAGESCKAIEASGLRGSVARAGADQSLIDEGEVRPLDEDLRSTEEFLMCWKDSARVNAWVGPAGFHNCSPRALTEFKKLAARNDTRFHIHLGESPRGTKEAKEAGFKGEVDQAASLGLLDENTSIAHAVWVGESEMDLIAAAGSQVVHCPTSNQILASGVAPIPAMMRKGICVALATDGAASNDSQDMFGELKSGALIHRVTGLDPAIMQARDVFRAATEGGAGVVGSGRLGRLAASYAADIIALQLRGNPSLAPCNDPIATVVFQASGRDVYFTMVEGKMVYRDGEFNTIDVDAAVERVTACVRFA